MRKLFLLALLLSYSPAMAWTYNNYQTVTTALDTNDINDAQLRKLLSTTKYGALSSSSLGLGATVDIFRFAVWDSAATNAIPNNTAIVGCSLSLFPNTMFSATNDSTRCIFGGITQAWDEKTCSWDTARGNAAGGPNLWSTAGGTYTDQGDNNDTIVFRQTDAATMGLSIRRGGAEVFTTSGDNVEVPLIFPLPWKISRNMMDSVTWGILFKVDSVGTVDAGNAWITRTAEGIGPQFRVYYRANHYRGGPHGIGYRAGPSSNGGGKKRVVVLGGI